MQFPNIRMRRLRQKNIRHIIKETILTTDDIICPIFVDETISIKKEIPSMEGIYRIPLNAIIEEVRGILKLKISAIILFGIPITKDEIGSSAYSDNGVIQKAVTAIKNEFGDDVVVITDVCLCEYTKHGHCGIFDYKIKKVLNDDTLPLLEKIAISHAASGADIVAPSGMMDGVVNSIRTALDSHGFESTTIMAYSAKYASSFYEPFRDAADSGFEIGDRTEYQMDFANSNEAIREVALDIEEGADIVMVKPALSYLDILYRIKLEFNIPIVAYSVSGEYAMIKLASKNGLINENKIIYEHLISIKRAGADIIITYFAKDIAKILNRWCYFDFSIAYNLQIHNSQREID